MNESQEYRKGGQELGNLFANFTELFYLIWI